MPTVLMSLPNNFSADQNLLIFLCMLTEASSLHASASSQHDKKHETLCLLYPFFFCFSKQLQGKKAISIHTPGSCLAQQHGFSYCVAAAFRTCDKFPPSPASILAEMPKRRTIAPPCNSPCGSCHHGSQLLPLQPSPQIRFILRHLLTCPVCSCSHSISSIRFK